MIFENFRVFFLIGIVMAFLFIAVAWPEIKEYLKFIIDTYIRK